MFNYKIVLKVSHVNLIFITNLINQLSRFLEYMFLLNITISIITLPNKRKTLTVLRSPHVSKKSREQYSQTIYSRLLVLNLKSLKLKKQIFFLFNKYLPLLNCEYKIIT